LHSYLISDLQISPGDRLITRRVFFSFHYKYVWKVNQIRSMPNITGTAAAGFQDASIWEAAKRIGDAAVKHKIDAALEGTSVTVVCVTHGTSQRKFINYEIDRSLERGNGLVAIKIHHLHDPHNPPRLPGEIPWQIAANGFKAYTYMNREDLTAWIEEAARLAGRPAVQGSLLGSGNPFSGKSGTSPSGTSNPFRKSLLGI
jgi:hypothetical protein